jgi:hypothetical protein
MGRMLQVVLSFIAAEGLCAATADSESVTLSNGIQMSIHTTLGKPTGQTSVIIEMERASGDSFFRIFRDQNHLAVFAYELEVARSGAAGFRLTTKPAGSEFARRFPYSDGGKPVPTFSADKDYALNSGEPVNLGIYELEGQGLTVVDTVQIGIRPDTAASSGGQLRFSGLSVSVNGVPFKAPSGSTVSGRYLMFYLPGQGGFFFASESVPGRQFMKAGYIDGNKMQFTVDNLSYDCTTLAPIAQQNLRQELWVYHDASYRPEGNWTLQEPEASSADAAAAIFFTAAADSLDWWMATSPEPGK